MRVQSIVLAGLAALAIPGAAMAQDNNQVDQVQTLSDAELARAETLLRELASDHVFDPMAVEAHFGIRIGDAWWTVKVDPVRTPSKGTIGKTAVTDYAFGPHGVALTRGKPEIPTWGFRIASVDVLEKIVSGEVNAGTAAMQSFGSDRVGVETGDMNGFSSTAGDEGDMYLVLSHFFTKGRPEVTRFGRDNALKTHGAQATALHYMKGFRVLHFSIAPDSEVNADPRLETGQMPNLFIITSGRGVMHTNDGPMPLEPGMSVFVAQYVKHHLVPEGEEPLEGILVLYGDNSDFAFGTSYPEYQQDLNAWNRTYTFRKDVFAADAEDAIGKGDGQ